MKALRHLIERIDSLVASPRPGIAESAALAMQELVATDDWLPEAMARSDPARYQQHLLYADPADRFSVVSFVWGPGQRTPIHNHTVWGVIGVLRGAEYSQRFDVAGSGAPRAIGDEELLNAGGVDIVSPTHGDVHVVRNAYDDRVSISIHLYGGNIGRIERSVFDPATGQRKPFVSGYSNALDPALIFPNGLPH
jgi:predicted metal-dependent enzyme (double-stranded beta helix superfamily)